MIGLEFIRKQFDMSLLDIAKNLDVTKQTVSKWENKTKPIPVKRLEDLSKLFNIPSEFFTSELTELEAHRIIELKYIHENNLLLQKEIKGLDNGTIDWSESDELDKKMYEQLAHGMYFTVLKALDEIKENYYKKMASTNIDDEKQFEVLDKLTKTIVEFDIAIQTGGEVLEQLQEFMGELTKEICDLDEISIEKLSE